MRKHLQLLIFFDFTKKNSAKTEIEKIRSKRKKKEANYCWFKSTEKKTV